MVMLPIPPTRYTNTLIHEERAAHIAEYMRTHLEEDLLDLASHLNVSATIVSMYRDAGVQYLQAVTPNQTDVVTYWRKRPSKAYHSARPRHTQELVY